MPTQKSVGHIGDIMCAVVSVSETYDLATKPNKMSLIAVHTPSKNLIAKSYPGLAVNHRFFKFLKCDIKLACASVLPADPLQIGTTVGTIAPQDMFNPILYKAVSNESLSTMEYRLRGLGTGAYGNNDHSLLGESVISQDSNVDGAADDFTTYYALLSNRDGFKVAHPQAGLSMTGLVPLVHERLYQFGDNAHYGTVNESPSIQSDQAGTGVLAGEQINYYMKGKAQPMPRINTLCLHTASTPDISTNFGLRENSNVLEVAVSDIPDLPKCYVAMIIMPPAKLNVLYYRLHVRWFISFDECRPISDILGFSGSGMTTVGLTFYQTNYSFAKLSDDRVECDLVDGSAVDIEKIMEGK